MYLVQLIKSLQSWHSTSLLGYTSLLIFCFLPFEEFLDQSHAGGSLSEAGRSDTRDLMALEKRLCIEVVDAEHW